MGYHPAPGRPGGCQLAAKPRSVAWAGGRAGSAPAGPACVVPWGIVFSVRSMGDHRRAGRAGRRDPSWGIPNLPTVMGDRRSSRAAAARDLSWRMLETPTVMEDHSARGRAGRAPGASWGRSLPARRGRAPRTARVSPWGIPCSVRSMGYHLRPRAETTRRLPAGQRRLAVRPVGQGTGRPPPSRGPAGPWGAPVGSAATGHHGRRRALAPRLGPLQVGQGAQGPQNGPRGRAGAGQGHRLPAGPQGRRRTGPGRPQGPATGAGRLGHHAPARRALLERLQTLQTPTRLGRAAGRSAATARRSARGPTPARLIEHGHDAEQPRGARTARRAAQTGQDTPHHGQGPPRARRGRLRPSRARFGTRRNPAQAQGARPKLRARAWRPEITGYGHAAAALRLRPFAPAGQGPPARADTARAEPLHHHRPGARRPRVQLGHHGRAAQPGPTDTTRGGSWADCAGGANNRDTI